MGNLGVFLKDILVINGFVAFFQEKNIINEYGKKIQNWGIKIIIERIFEVVKDCPDIFLSRGNLIPIVHN